MDDYQREAHAAATKGCLTTSANLHILKINCHNLLDKEIDDILVDVTALEAKLRKLTDLINTLPQR